MKKIIVIITLFSTNLLFANYYVVVNEDQTIHTVEENPYEILTNNQVRYKINKIPYGFKNEHYIWDNRLIKKSESEIAKIEENHKERIRKLLLSEKVMALKNVEAIEKIDVNADYTEEKKQLQKQINKLKK